MADRPQITHALLVLSSLPNCPIKDGNLEIIIDAYQIVLKDLPGEDVQAATMHYLSTGTFFPTPGQLRRTVMDLRLSASGIPTAAEAWADVGHALRYIDAHYCPEGQRMRDMAMDANDAHDGAGYVRWSEPVQRAYQDLHRMPDCAHGGGVLPPGGRADGETPGRARGALHR